MTTPYNSNFDISVPFSDTCVQVHVTVAAIQTYTVPGAPTAVYSARFTYASNTNVFVGINVAPTPLGPDTIATHQYVEFRPGGNDGSQRYVKGGDVLQFATPDASAYIGVSLRQLPG